MPIQAPQWTDYLNCPVCCREFGAPPRSPISLGCGHTLCRHCIKHLHRKQCPFDQTAIQQDGEELVVNTALLQLAGYSPPSQPYHPPCIQALPDSDRQAYDLIVRCMEHLAVYLKYCGNANGNISGCRLSRPMQRKLVTLLQCSMTDEDGRGRAARAARSLGERTVTELILQHQNPQQLSANLWAAVRARGCQFLGPAMQEEVLKLVLLALEDGSALSRKVLVMFVVQRLEPHFPQASKTSIGHVVQLLYRASCFKVSKRECDSSLMQLKEEFRTYESLRREHDAQIVQIATEAGLRIAPDQWSAVLYGDTGHKSHMQSIIDKLQTPQSFAQSVQELFIALQRTGDPAHLGAMSMHLDYLASIDASPDAKSPSWQQLADTLCALREVVSSLSHYLQQQAIPRDNNHNKPHDSVHTISQQSPSITATTPTHNRYKVSLCRDAATRSFCPRGNSCTFAHSEEELERYRSAPSQAPSNGNFAYHPLSTMPLPPVMPQQLSRSMPQLPLPMNMYPRFRLPHPHVDNFNLAGSSSMPPSQALHPEVPQNPEFLDNIQAPNFSAQVVPNQPLAANQNTVILPMSERSFYNRYSVPHSTTFQDDSNHFMPDFAPPVYNGFQAQVNGYQAQVNGYQGQAEGYQGQSNGFPGTANGYQGQANGYQEGIGNMFVHEVDVSSYQFDDRADFRMKQGFVPERRTEPTWPPNANDVFNFDGMRNTLGQCSTSTDDIFNVSGDRLAVGGTLLPSAERASCSMEMSDMSNMADDIELEEELQALERRIDTEFKSTD